MDYETKIFPHTGGYGRYNRLVVIFSWFPNFAVMLNLFSDVLFTLIPDSYHCKPDPQLLPSAFLPSNFSRQGYLNLTIPWVNGTGLSHCELFKYPPNTSDFSEKVPRDRVSCTVGWEYAHVAGLHSNFVTEDQRQEFSQAVDKLMLLPRPYEYSVYRLHLPWDYTLLTLRKSVKIKEEVPWL